MMGPQERYTAKQIAAKNAELAKSVKANKYKAIRTTVDGITFDSKREAAYYQELKLRERLGEITNLQLQRRFPMIIEDTDVGAYLADFVFNDLTKPGEEGVMQVIDIKGFSTPLFKFKKRVFEAIYGIPIQVVK